MLNRATPRRYVVVWKGVAVKVGMSPRRGILTIGLRRERIDGMAGYRGSIVDFVLRDQLLFSGLIRL